MKDIVLYPNPILRGKVGVVDKIDEELEKEMADLGEILSKCENGAGLAAVQIGVKKRFFGVKEAKTKRIKIFLNPKIEAVFGDRVYPRIKKDDGEWGNFYEGCLSFPGVYGTVKRYLKVRAKWQEVKNKKIVNRNRILLGFEAIVFQHELDHLNGILFIDHIKRDQGKLYRQVGEEMVETSL